MACKIVLSNIINTTLFNEKSYNISVIALVLLKVRRLFAASFKILLAFAISVI